MIIIEGFIKWKKEEKGEKMEKRENNLEVFKGWADKAWEKGEKVGGRRREKANPQRRTSSKKKTDQTRSKNQGELQ